MVLDGEDGEGITSTEDTLVVEAGVDGKVNDDGVEVSAEAGFTVGQVEAGYSKDIGENVRIEGEVGVEIISGSVKAEAEIKVNQEGFNVGGEVGAEAILYGGDISGGATISIFDYDITINGSADGSFGVGASGEANASFNAATGDFDFTGGFKVIAGLGGGGRLNMSGRRRTPYVPSNSSSNGNTNKTKQKEDED